jgi:hypothetical protein
MPWIGLSHTRKCSRTGAPGCRTDAPENLRFVIPAQADAPENPRFVIPAQADAPENPRFVIPAQADAPENPRFVIPAQAGIQQALVIPGPFAVSSQMEPESMSVRAEAPAINSLRPLLADAPPNRQPFSGFAIRSR